jgi:hypothetical protein
MVAQARDPVILRAEMNAAGLRAAPAMLTTVVDVPRAELITPLELMLRPADLHVAFLYAVMS